MAEPARKLKMSAACKGWLTELTACLNVIQYFPIQGHIDIKYGHQDQGSGDFLATESGTPSSSKFLSC
jgi:hypothetical protein